mgnify:CR=1 FL=1
MAERSPWGNFPAVIRNGDLGELQQQPEYTLAKAGDTDAAHDLAERLLRNGTIDQIRNIIGNDQPRIVPVLAEEASGHNKIPLAMAFEVGKRLGLDVDVSIFQTERVARTGEGADYRLAFNPSFDGPVKKGGKYLVFDDTLTMGGTIASLRGFLENRGGNVIAAAVMTAHLGALNIAVKPSMLEAIDQKHGSAMNDFWKETFGYGIDQLTQGEAGHLRKSPSVDAIRTRIIEARLASYHQALKKLEIISAPRHEVLVAQCKLAIAEEFYNSGRLDVPGAHSAEIREQAHEEALLLMAQSGHESAVSPLSKPKQRIDNVIKKQTGPKLDM